MLVAVGFIVRLNVAVSDLHRRCARLADRNSTARRQRHHVREREAWSREPLFRFPARSTPGRRRSATSGSARWSLQESPRSSASARVWSRQSKNFARGSARPQSTEATSRDLASGPIAAFSMVCIVLIALIYYHFTRSVPVTSLAVVVMILMAFFFTAVASYIVGLVGNSNSPVSGMTITAVLFTGGMLWICGFKGTEGMVAVLGVAAVVCCVACTSGDVCNDLKTGSLVGAAPFRQQIMQVLGVFVAAFTMAPVLNLLHNNTDGGIGGPNLPAAQANLFASLAKGIFGDGNIPWDMVQIGVGVGVALLLIDGVLKSRKSSFRMHVMPVAVGMYLPFGLSTPILIGGLIAHFAARGSKPGEETERRLHKGILFGSGVIAGEALMGVGIAGLAAAGYKHYNVVEQLEARIRPRDRPRNLHLRRHRRRRSLPLLRQLRQESRLDPDMR